MKRLLAAVFLMVLMAAACGKSSNPSSPGGGNPTPTPGTPTPVPQATVTTSGTTFLNNSVTITIGQYVNWTLGSGHTLVIDNGSGTCATGPINGPTVYQQVFPTAGTFQFHCSSPGHSTCNASTCSGCSGMIGTVTVNP